MALFALKRVVFRNEDGSEDWVDMRPLSADAYRHLRSKSSAAVPMEGEDETEAQGFAIQYEALCQCIAGWSDDLPVTPENVRALPLDVTLELQKALGLGGREDAPLPSGSPSTATSEASEEESSPTSG
jgi:hypothetical protein